MFYGWVIVAVTFLTQFVAVGSTFYSFGVLQKPFAEDLGGSRMAVGAAMPLMMIVVGLAGPFIGRAIHRGSIRAVMLLGVGALSAGFLALSRVEELWQFYLVFGLVISLGMALVGGIANTALVATWFVWRRGTALGISQIGTTISGMVTAYAASWLVAELGWRGTAVVYGVAPLALLLPVVWFLVVARPEDRQLRPDGGAHRHGEHEPPSPTAWTFGRVLRERTIWLIALVVGLSFAGTTAVILQIYPHVTDLGYSASQAAAVLSVMAGTGALGKILFGWLADRYDRRGCMWGAILFQVLGLVGIINAGTHVSLLGSGALFGLGFGGVLPLWGVLLGAAYGRAEFGRILGLMSPMMIPFETLGIPFAGWVFDRTGSYNGAFLTFLGLYAIAAVALVFLRLPARATLKARERLPDLLEHVD